MILKAQDKGAHGVVDGEILGGVADWTGIGDDGAAKAVAAEHASPGVVGRAHFAFAVAVGVD